MRKRLVASCGLAAFLVSLVLPPAADAASEGKLRDVDVKTLRRVGEMIRAGAP